MSLQDWVAGILVALALATLVWRGRNAWLRSRVPPPADANGPKSDQATGTVCAGGCGGCPGGQRVRATKGKCH